MIDGLAMHSSILFDDSEGLRTVIKSHLPSFVAACACPYDGMQMRRIG
jgi:hypothetical protein